MEADQEMQHLEESKDKKRVQFDILKLLSLT